jgi:hypothetical protein
MTSHRFSLGEASPFDHLANAEGRAKDIVVLFDADSLILQKVADQHTHLLPALENDAEFNHLRIAYYLDLRSSVAICPKIGTNPDPNELLATRKSIFNALMNQATLLALEQTQSGKPFQPAWLDVFIDQYRQYMPSHLQPLLASVNLKVVHDGYMTARVDKQRNILLSSKLKPFLAAWNTLALMSDDRHGPGEHLLRPALAYCLQPATGFGLMRLSVIGYPDTIVFQSVRKLTTAQIQFLLLHELGHAHYDHNAIVEPCARADDPGLKALFSSVPYRMYQEHEADVFALREVLSSLPADMEGMTDLFAVAMEFLFSFIMCMEATGRKVRKLRNPDAGDPIAVFTERLRVLRSLQTGYGWHSTDGIREADTQKYTSLAELFTARFLDRLDRMSAQQLADEIRHRHGG